MMKIALKNTCTFYLVSEGFVWKISCGETLFGINNGLFSCQILYIILGGMFKNTYGSDCPGRGKWAKSVIIFFSFSVTKQFDFFKFSQLF